MVRGYQMGLGLLELVLSLALGLLLAAVLMVGFSSGLRHWSQQQARGQLLADGRLLHSLLLEAVSGAGYAGCAAWGELQWSGDADLLNAVRLGPVVLVGAGEPLPLSGGWNTGPLLFTQAMASETATLKSAFAKQVTLGLEPVLKPGKVIIVADCQQALITTVLAVKRSVHRGLQWVSLADPVPSHSHAMQLGLYQQNRFFVKPTTRHNQRDQVITSLYWQNQTKQQQELIAGVSTWSLDWLNSNKQIAIEALLVSPEAELTHAQRYWFHGQSHHASDRRLYWPWFGVFTLENKG